ncbi:hypothetical protein BCR34DRAFT_608020 [Clohesyomyces aquaticus]|uniref:Uncharacterized protein n=1 Tax=Clohesyomyces aquaticus TaxID=1231657 RepID=A0A1Y1YC75_9PLEO|nr:hypothetical protein BCR34DRAFT_608020 [Clohesyomyces aquaticus]
MPGMISILTHDQVVVDAIPALRQAIAQRTIRKPIKDFWHNPRNHEYRFVHAFAAYYNWASLIPKDNYLSVATFLPVLFSHNKNLGLPMSYEVSVTLNKAATHIPVLTNGTSVKLVFAKSAHYIPGDFWPGTVLESGAEPGLGRVTLLPSTMASKDRSGRMRRILHYRKRIEGTKELIKLSQARPAQLEGRTQEPVTDEETQWVNSEGSKTTEKLPYPYTEHGILMAFHDFPELEFLQLL